MTHRRLSLAVLIEIAFALVILSSIGWVWYEFSLNSYLPQPFISDPYDTFGDWYNPAYYANQTGAYDSIAYESVYPPISFLFMKLFSIHSCYTSDTEWARDCDWLGRTVLFVVVCLNALVVLRAYWLTERKTAIQRTVAVAFGLPMLYGLERGNLILVCFTFFALGYGPVLRSAILRWLSVAVAINFKPYLVLTVVPLLLRRRWRAFEGIGLASLVIYLITLGIEGAGTPAQIIANTIAFSNATQSEYWNDFYFGTTYQSVADFLGSALPILHDVGSPLAETGAFVFPLLIHLGQAVTLLALFVAWRNPAAAPKRRLVTLMVALILSSTEPSGYAEIFLLFLVFFEPWRGLARIVALVSAYLLCISYDYMIVPVLFLHKTSWLGGRPVDAIFGLAIGQLIRPGLILAIEMGLSVATIQEFLKLSAAGRRPRPPALETALPLGAES